MSHNAQTAPRRSDPTRLSRVAWLVLGSVALGALASSFYFHRLGAAPLFGDEAIHTLVARETARGERWLPPTYDGRPYLAKPPLKILAVAWIFHRFGESEWNARVLDAGLGVATVVLVFLFGSRLWGMTEGALAALLLATAQSYVFHHGVREGVQDSALVFFLTAGLVLYRLRLEMPSRRHSWLVASGLAVGLGALVKGAAAGLALPVLAAWEVTRCWRTQASWASAARRLATVAGLALACYGVWLVAAYSWTDGAVVQALYRDVWVRVSESVDPSHVHGPAFYPLRLAHDFGPWLLAVVPALLVFRRRPEAPGDGDGVLSVLLWALVMLGLLSLSRSKLAWYLYPAYPAVALLLARGTGEAIRLAFRFRLLALALAALALLGVWLRIEGIRSRLEAEPPRVHAARYARAVAELPRTELVIDRRAELRAWELYYLAPLGRRTRRLPPEVRSPSPGLCRFLIRIEPEAPEPVEARRPVPALPLRFLEGGRQLWLQDLDRCLPVWL